jgi:nucleoside 2-deoxyribosyltransferase
MEIYLAAPWVEKDLMDDRARAFEDLGHTITWKWWNVKEDPEANHPALRLQAEDDYAGVKRAEVLILFNTGLSEGKSFEQGVATAFCKPIIAIGSKEVSKNVFHYMGNYTWVYNLNDALFVLGNNDVKSWWKGVNVREPK